jgi:YebC/PmpR family DNA-binding regulatory protein
MSGHSKWSTIKRKKGTEDAKRGKIFTRLARDITMAAREGGGDENGNPRLKLAIAKARANNMPKDNIERAIAKASGGGAEGDGMEEITYEGYGPDGIAYLIDVLTDNKNRSLADVKRTLNRANGSLASAGSVAWQFERKGFIALTQNKRYVYDEVFMVAAEAGADDVADADGTLLVYTPREKLAAVETALSNAGYSVAESELRWEAKNESDLPVDKAMQNVKLYEMLEELDDVQAVASNLMMTDAVLAALETA